MRIYALWSRIAPNSPSGENDWAQFDHAVDRVTPAGMKPILTITGPGPLWVSRRSERGEPRYDPDPKLFGKFAGQVAARYGDRVDRYIVWNEPNLGGWLRPQGACNGSKLHAGRAAPVPRPRRRPPTRRSTPPTAPRRC